MTRPKTIGFPRMLVEAGEKRVFLPEFIKFLTNLGLKVFLEDGYGSRLGYRFDDYKRGNDHVLNCSRDDAFKKDIVLILRAPKREEYSKLGSNSCLISMLHFSTRPARVEALVERNAKAISLDNIIDDNNIRRVENMEAVAWNGLETAYNILEHKWVDLIRPDKQPIKVLILGTGMVGKYAVDAGTKLGNLERYNDHIAAGGPGALTLSVGRAVTTKPEIMRSLMETTDILVDATQRRDTSKPVIPNEWIAWLPPHAVITDLAVDPYLLDSEPPVVRGVEGIPQGNLDQYIFHADDPKWCDKIPEGIPVSHRRTAVSCYSWPGIHPEACMEHYAAQISPIMEVFVEKGYEELSLGGSFFERALYRGTLKAHLESL
jgi:alanine dehydrogenase